MDMGLRTLEAYMIATPPIRRAPSMHLDRAATPLTVPLAAAVLILLAAPDLAAQTIRNPPKIWVDVCQRCHGDTGGNGSAQSLLDDQWIGDGSNDWLFESIDKGVPDRGMPAYGETLTDEEIRALVIYIRELRSQHERGGVEGGHVADHTRYESKLHDFTVTTVVDGLEIPWSMEVLPNGDWLVVERPGRLRLVAGGESLVDPPIADTPEVLAVGQGGLLEVKLHPDYEDNGWVYLAFSEPRTIDGRELAMTTVVRGRIDDHAWTEQQDIYRAKDEHFMRTRYHYGTRIAFDDDGYLFFPIGDRGRKQMAQDLGRPNGKIHRLHDDGRVPDDNPFVDRSDALPSIWSYGHRNPQGLDFHPATGELWESEHGPRGGDEINRIEKGVNYGWPVITYGMNYNGTPITDRTHAPGMAQPVTQWTPSIAVIGIDFYEGDRFPQWKHDLFVSSIASGNLRRLRVDGDDLIEDELLFNDQGRLRDVHAAPDGYLYVLTTEGRILRLAPAQ